MKRFLARLALFTTGSLIVLEVFFRTAVPAAETPRFILDPARGFVVNDTAGPRSGVFTAGRRAHVRTHWNVNDDGWLSTHQYRRPAADRPPVAALVGDSYVEGIHVNPDDNIGPVLEEALHREAAVYSFGTPGAGLAHYAWMTPHIVERYEPAALVYFIVEGDLEESVAELWANPLAAQYVWNGQTFRIRKPSYRARPLRRMLRRSALARYLLINVRLVLPGDGARTEHTGRDAALIRHATERALEDIGRCTGDIPVLFVLDAQRDSIYEASDGSFRDNATNRTAKQALRNAGIAVLDLTPIFQRDFAAHRRRFNYRVNYHWNPYARRRIAEHIAQWLRSQRLTADSTARSTRPDSLRL